MGKTPEILSNENRIFYPGEDSFNWAWKAEADPERDVREAMIFINMIGEGAIGKKICGIEEPKEDYVIVNDDVSNVELNGINKLLLIAAEKRGKSDPVTTLALSIFQEFLISRDTS